MILGIDLVGAEILPRGQQQASDRWFMLTSITARQQDCGALAQHGSRGSWASAELFPSYNNVELAGIGTFRYSKCRLGSNLANHGLPLLQTGSM